MREFALRDAVTLPAAGIIAALLLAACSTPSAAGIPSSSPSVSPTFAPITVVASPTAAPTVAPTLPVDAVTAQYGSLAVRTSAGASCTAELGITPGAFGETPPKSLSQQVAGADGTVTWAYSAPRGPRGSGTYNVTCRGVTLVGSTSGTIFIGPRSITPSGFTVHVSTDRPPQPSCVPDPSLTPLRDATAAKLKATLAAEWKAATRGLGSLQVVETSADITIFVVAGRGFSVHRGSPDDSEDVELCVQGQLGPRNVENSVAVALHELGHIWCCSGLGTDGAGHWSTKETSPGLYGVDKYGLMTDPVTCVSFGTILSCPNRFSDREMLALGFKNFPPPAPDPCIVQALALGAQLASIDSQLATLKGQIDSSRATLVALYSQITSIEQQYPSGRAPTSVLRTYRSLISQYNTLNGQFDQLIDSYNLLVDRAHSVAVQINSLPCDPY
jgi:hypothetical protein